MMKDFFNRFWTPIAGAISSLSFKGINDINSFPEFTDTAEQVARHALKSPQPELITYLWIGVLGGLGGLLVKIAWGCIKKIFPKLKGLDK
jgi:hypothetical protein